MKKVLILGGSGALGKSVVNTFKLTKPNWNVINLDFIENKNADSNYKLNSTNFTSKEEISKIGKSEFLQNKLDCIINVAGGWRGGSIESEDILESTQQMMSMNLYSTLLSAHLAKKFLKENSLLIFTGANSVKEGMHSWMMGYQLSKNSVHHLTEVLLKNPNELPNNTKLITILPNTIDTESNRKAMPDADFSSWTKPEEIAKVMKKWADEKNYPSDTYYKF
jgi:dihydropteridine reductase